MYLQVGLQCFYLYQTTFECIFIVPKTIQLDYLDYVTLTHSIYQISVLTRLAEVSPICIFLAQV